MPAPSSEQADGAPALRRTRIWDLPTRLFHWLLATAVVGLVVTGRDGIMEWHFRLGYAVLALLMFRVVWGVVGGRWSRFGVFVRGPRAVVDHLAGRTPPGRAAPGHTPLGALSVLAMLAVLGVQVATGLVADDQISAAGPLAQRVPVAVSDAATAWHAERGQWLVIALLGLHVAAIAYYVAFRRRRLIGSMLSGDQMLAAGPHCVPSRDDMSSRLLALAIFAACAGCAAWIGSLRA